LLTVHLHRYRRLLTVHLHRYRRLLTVPFHRYSPFADGAPNRLVTVTAERQTEYAKTAAFF
jgi:hypothetical protein